MQAALRAAADDRFARADLAELAIGLATIGWSDRAGSPDFRIGAASLEFGESQDATRRRVPLLAQNVVSAQTNYASVLHLHCVYNGISNITVVH